MLKTLIISLLLATAVFAADPITPRFRVTEIDKLPQHQNVQRETYEYINMLKSDLDSNYQLYAMDTVGTDSSDTVYLSSKYLVYVVAPSVMSDIAHSISWQFLSDSSFAVKADSSDLPYSWIAIGVKK
jgi:hypothetical protein